MNAGRDRGILATAVVTVLVVTVYGLGLVPRPTLGVLSWTALAAGQMVEVWLCLAIAGLPNLGPAVSRFYRVVGCAAALFSAASLVQVVVAVRSPGSTVVITGSPVHVALLAGGAVLLILAMLTSPLGLTSKRERTRFWLDAAVVMVGVGLFAWHLSGYAGDGTDTAPSAGGLVYALVGPAAFVVVAFGLVKISLGGNAVFTRTAGLLGGIAAVLESVNTASVHSLLAAGRGSWLLGLGVLANVTFVAALRVQYLQSRSATIVTRNRDRQVHSRLPYVAVAACYGLLIWVLLGSSLSLHAWVVLGGAIVSSALVVARQMAAFADNDDLLRRLNAKVEELAEAKGVLQHALSERDALAERLHHLAYHDSLTGLANRAQFLDRLEAALTAGDTPTVVIIDLDDFKPVNDRHGHNAGDALLRAVAARMSGCVGDSGTVARLGGDEFAILLPRTGSGADLAALVAAVTVAVGEPVPIGSGAGAAEVRVRASVGTATATGPPDDAGALLHRADLAMYADKRVKPGLAGIGSAPGTYADR